MSNESKWVTLIGGLVAAAIPLAIAYGLFTSEQGELWQTLVMAIVALVVPIVVTSLAKNYNDNETVLLTVMAEQETARIMAGRD